MPRDGLILIRRGTGVPGPGTLLEGEPALDLTPGQEKIYAGRGGVAQLLALPIAGGELRGGLSFGQRMGDANRDFSKHISLYDGWGGIGVTGGRLNITTGGVAAFVDQNTDADIATFQALRADIHVPTQFGARVWLSVDPGSPLEAATRQYVDNAIAGGPFLPIDGSRAMTGGLKLGSAIVGDPLDLSRHISLYGDTDGFSITPSRLNYVASAGSGTHAFYGAVLVNGDLNTRGMLDAPWIRFDGATDFFRLVWDGSGVRTIINGWDGLGNFATASWVGNNYLPLTGGYLSGALTVNGRLHTNDFLTFSRNTSPGDLPGALGTLCWNLTQGQGEIDFINGFDAPGFRAGFRWYQTRDSGAVESVAALDTSGNLNIAGNGISYDRLTGSGNYMGFTWSGSIEVYVDGVHRGHLLREVEADTRYIQIANASASYLPLIGGLMAGAIYQPNPPTTWGELTNKEYVDALVTSLKRFMGVWQVAANIPNITSIIGHTAGDYYIAVTANPNFPENAPAGIPGIAGQELHNGDMVIFNETLQHYEIVRGSPLTKVEADNYYLTGQDAHYLRLDGTRAMAAGLRFGSSTVVDGLDVSRHIALWESGDQYGFSITGGTLNYVAGGTVGVGATARHLFHGAVELDRDPLLPSGAATRRYVDAHRDPGGPFLSLLGGTLSGPLWIEGLPSDTGAQLSLLPTNFQGLNDLESKLRFYGTFGTGVGDTGVRVVGSLRAGFTIGNAWGGEYLDVYLNSAPNDASTDANQHRIARFSNSGLAIRTGISYNNLPTGNPTTIVGFAWEPGNRIRAYLDGFYDYGLLATTGDLGGYLPLGGGTLSGVVDSPVPATYIKAQHFYTYNVTPGPPDELTSKQYVDGFLHRSGGTIAWLDVNPAFGITYGGITSAPGAAHAIGFKWSNRIEMFVDNFHQGAIASLGDLAGYVVKAGDTMTGTLTLTGDPARTPLFLTNGASNVGGPQTQITFTYQGTTQYHHWMTSRHNGAAVPGNAIDFWLGDGTPNAVFPVNATWGGSFTRFGLSLPRGSTANPSLNFENTTNNGDPGAGMFFDGAHIGFTVPACVGFGQGGISLNPGGPNPGYLELFAATGLRAGYIGFADGSQTRMHIVTNGPYTGWDVSGSLLVPQGVILPNPPAAAASAANKEYVDALVAALRLFRGTWSVAANTPTLPDPDETAGDYYIAVTVNPNDSETAPGGIPGIGGMLIHNGDMVIWDEVTSTYELVRGSPLTKIEADSYYLTPLQGNTTYLRLDGGTVTGPLRVMNGIGIDFGANNFRFLWTGSSAAMWVDGPNFIGHIATQEWTDTYYLPLSGAKAMTGGLKFGSDVAPGGELDVSRHIDLWGGAYGFNVTGSTLNYKANPGSQHKFHGGPILLDTGPSLPMHAATKAYVDANAGGAHVGTTPPAVASPGGLWWHSDEGNLFIRYNDGGSEQWVPANAAAGPQGIQGPVGPQGIQGVQGAIGPQGVQGNTGLQGNPGLDGAVGPQGPVGPPGPAGFPQGMLGNILGVNKVHNGLFNINQRGLTTFATPTATGVMTFDRWILRMAGTGTTSAVYVITNLDRNSIGDSAPLRCININVTSNAAGSFTTLGQRLEDVGRFSGRKFTVSFYMATSRVAGTFVAASIDLWNTTAMQNAQVQATVQAGGMGVWHRYAMTIDVPFIQPAALPAVTSAELRIWLNKGTADGFGPAFNGVGTHRIWGVQMEEGDEATVLEKPDPAFDLANCMRFYQTGYARTAASANIAFPFPVRMRDVPVIVSAPGNNVQSIAGQPGHYLSNGTGTAAGVTFTAAAEFVAG